MKQRARGWASQAGAALRQWRRAYSFWLEMAAGGASYPVFRRELRYWDQGLGGRWRYEEFFALLALVNLCLTPATLLIFPNLLLVQAVLDEILGLCIAVPAATLVVGERDRRTWSLLRSTTLSSAEILVGKLAGLLYLLWQGAKYVVMARLVGTLLAAPLLGLILFVPQSFPFAAGRPVVLTSVGLLLVYLGFVYRPLLNLMYSGCVGLLASTLAGSRPWAIGLALVLEAGLALLSAGLVAWFVRTVDLGWLFSGSVLAGQLRQVYVWLIPFGLVVLARLLVMPAFFGLAIYRVDRRLE